MATLLQTLLNNESSGGRNIANTTSGTDSGQAQGYFQITTGTWKEFAKKVGIDTNKYPTPMTAADGTPVPYSVQAQVASAIPLKRWAPSTVALMSATGKAVDPNKTLGENLAANGEVFDDKATASQNALPTPQTGDYKVAREDTPSSAKPTSDTFNLPPVDTSYGDSPSETGGARFGGTGLGTPPTKIEVPEKSSPWPGGGNMPAVPGVQPYTLPPVPAAVVAKAQSAPMVNTEQQMAQRQQLAMLLQTLNANKVGGGGMPPAAA